MVAFVLGKQVVSVAAAPSIHYQCQRQHHRDRHRLFMPVYSYSYYLCVVFVAIFVVVIVNGLICMMISSASYLDRLIYLLVNHMHLSSMSHSTGLYIYASTYCPLTFLVLLDLLFFCVKIHHPCCSSVLFCFSIPLPFGIE